jgi:hypothetical protein
MQEPPNWQKHWAPAACPTGLQLHLSNDTVSEAGASQPAEALSNGHCPTGLQLHLVGNRIGNAGTAHLANALSTGFCPIGLQLNLHNNEISKAVLNQIHTLLEIHEKKQAAITWVAFHHGLRPSHPLLKKIPDVVAQNIFSFLAPRATGENLGLFFKQVKHKALPELSFA